MKAIKLIEPTMECADDIWKFRDEVVEIDANNENQFAGCAGLGTSESPEEWVKSCILRKDEKRCSETDTTVPSNMYLAIRQSDNKIVGIIDLRHHINHHIFGTWGGHCGYSVRPSERGGDMQRKCFGSI